MDISINKLMELTGVDRRTIKKRLTDAGLTPRKVGRSHNYESTQVLPVIYAATNAPTGPQPTGSPQGPKDVLDKDQEQARLAMLKADHQEIVNAEKRKELITVAEVANAWGRIITSIRNQFLALPNRLAQMLETTGSTNERREMIDREVKTILTALAEKGGNDANI